MSILPNCAVCVVDVAQHRLVTNHHTSCVIISGFDTELAEGQQSDLEH